MTLQSETLPATDANTDSPPDAPARDRVLAVAGIGFAALLVPVVLIPHAGLDYPIDKPPASSVITAFYRQHYVLEQWQALMHSLAGVALLIFGLALAGQVRRADRGAGTAARIVAGGAIAASTIMVSTMLLVAGSVSQTGAIDGRTQGWLYNIGWTEHFKSLYFAPLLIVPACLVLARTRALPRLLTWPGLVVAAVAFVAMVGGLTAGTEFLQYPAFMLLLLWVLATGLVAAIRGVGPRR